MDRLYSSSDSASLCRPAQSNHDGDCEDGCGVSRQTLYQHLRLAIEALQWGYQSKQRLSSLLSQLYRYRRQSLVVQHQAKQAQGDV